MRKLQQRSILKLDQSNHTTVTVCKRRPMGDVNKGAWPTEVKRSSEVNQHFAKDETTLKCLNYISGNSCLLTDSRAFT